MPTRPQGITLATGICIFIGILVVIQLWLMAAAVDALLADQFGVLVPAAIASAALFAVNGGLLLHLRTFDRRLREGRFDA